MVLKYVSAMFLKLSVAHWFRYSGAK